jgi:hypothetical protein
VIVAWGQESAGLKAIPHSFELDSPFADSSNVEDDFDFKTSGEHLLALSFEG